MTDIIDRLRRDDLFNPNTNREYQHEVAGRAADEIEDLRARIAELEQKIDCLLNAGHDPNCGGMDELNDRCDCGWLQRAGGHEYILNLERQLAEAREDGERLHESLQTFRQRFGAALQDNCICGGGQPGDCCAVCDVYHRVRDLLPVRWGGEIDAARGGEDGETDE